MDWWDRVDFKVWVEPRTRINPVTDGEPAVPPAPLEGFNPMDPMGEVKKRKWFVGFEVRF